MWRGACLLESSGNFHLSKLLLVQGPKVLLLCLGCPARDLCHCSSLARCTLKACSLIWSVRLCSDLGCAELERQKSYELNVFVFAAYDCEVMDLMILFSPCMTAQLCGLGTLSTEIDPMGGKMVKHHFNKE